MIYRNTFSVVADDLQHAAYYPPEFSYAQTASGVTEQLQLIIVFVSGKVFLFLSVLRNDPFFATFTRKQ